LADFRRPDWLIRWGDRRRQLDRFHLVDRLGVLRRWIRGNAASSHARKARDPLAIAAGVIAGDTLRPLGFHLVDRVGLVDRFGRPRAIRQQR